MSYSKGDVVLLNARGREIEAVVVSARMIQRGRNAGKIEYKLAPFEKRGNEYEWTVKGESLLSPSKKKHTEFDIAAVAGEHQSTAESIADRKRDRVQEGNDVLEEIEIGDEVRYRYTNALKWERVAKVNYKTGKIGIDRYRNGDAFLRNAPARAVQWIPAQGVTEVRAHQERFPQVLDSSQRSQLEKDGWIQIRFGKEFIEKSYVVSLTKKNAKLGTNYDEAERLVHHDPMLGVYWRKTGMFD